MLLQEFWDFTTDQVNRNKGLANNINHCLTYFPGRNDLILFQQGLFELVSGFLMRAFSIKVFFMFLIGKLKSSSIEFHAKNLKILTENVQKLYGSG